MKKLLLFVFVLFAGVSPAQTLNARLNTLRNQVSPSNSTMVKTVAMFQALVDSLEAGVVGGGGVGDLKAINNLNDINDAATALSNLGGAPLSYSTHTITGDYTLSLSDFTTPTELICNSSSPIVITVPTNASVAIPIKRGIRIRNINTGLVTISPAGGVVFNNQSNVFTLAANNAYAFMVVQKDAINTWTIDNTYPTGVGNSQLSPMAPSTVKGQPNALLDGGTTTTPVDLTEVQLRNIINNRASNFSLYSDFGGGTSNEWHTAVSGTGSSVSFTTDGGDAGHPGVATLNVGTSTTGFAVLRNGNTSVLRLGDGINILDFSLKLSALSDGTDTYTCFVGYGANTAAGNGAWFQYTHGTNSGKWQFITQVSGGNQNVEDTGVAATTGYLRFTIVSNSNSTLWKGYINGVQVGTNHTTNVPAASLQTSAFISIIKSAGTTNRSIGLDYISLRQELTTSR